MQHGGRRFRVLFRHPATRASVTDPADAENRTRRRRGGRGFGLSVQRGRPRVERASRAVLLVVVVVVIIVIIIIIVVVP